MSNEAYDPDIEFLDWMKSNLERDGTLDDKPEGASMSYRELIDGMIAGETEEFRTWYHKLIEMGRAYAAFLRWKGEQDRQEGGAH